MPCADNIPQLGCCEGQPITLRIVNVWASDSGVSDLGQMARVMAFIGGIDMNAVGDNHCLNYRVGGAPPNGNPLDPAITLESDVQFDTSGFHYSPVSGWAVPDKSRQGFVSASKTMVILDTPRPYCIRKRAQASASPSCVVATGSDPIPNVSNITCQTFAASSSFIIPIPSDPIARASGFINICDIQGVTLYPGGQSGALCCNFAP
jgi:hypothetical protein